MSISLDENKTDQYFQIINTVLAGIYDKAVYEEVINAKNKSVLNYTQASPVKNILAHTGT